MAGRETSQSRAGDHGPRLEGYAVITGNAMVDQFQPWYFGVAFSFVFGYCTGMPDMHHFAETQRHRRQADAPRVEPPAWVRIMGRRVEAQLSRDWHCGFVAWNYLFRSAVNLSRTFFLRASGKADDDRDITAAEWERGAQEICKALGGSYEDGDGRKRSVGGDMTKVRYVPTLSPAAKRLLQHIEHTSRKVPGTQETRRMMRFDTHVNRVRYGVSIFVTYTPNEAQNMVMLRLSRTRLNDPVFAEGHDAPGKSLCGRRQPPLGRELNDNVVFGVSVDNLSQALPSHDQRRAILSCDPLASADGFRVVCAVTTE